MVSSSFDSIPYAVRDCVHVSLCPLRSYLQCVHLSRHTNPVKIRILEHVPNFALSPEQT